MPQRRLAAISRAPSFDPTCGSDRLFGVQAFAADELAEQVRVVTLDHFGAVAPILLVLGEMLGDAPSEDVRDVAKPKENPA
jgi:hypothetical protein